MNDTTFEKDLEHLINRHSVENQSDTPDFILARYMQACLDAFNAASRRREQWYGKGLRIGGVVRVNPDTGEEALAAKAPYPRIGDTGLTDAELRIGGKTPPR